MEVKKPSRCRRTHQEEFKQADIEACCEPGASVAGIALANGVNANQVRRWMREREIKPPSRRETLAGSAIPAFVPVSIPAAAEPMPDFALNCIAAMRRSPFVGRLVQPMNAAPGYGNG